MSDKMKWVYKPTMRYFANRKEAKEYLGGITAFNVALKNGEIRYLSNNE